MLLAFPSAEVDNNLFYFAYSALILSARARVSGRYGADQAGVQSVKDKAAAIVTFFSLLTEKDRETAEAYLTLVATSHRG